MSLYHHPLMPSSYCPRIILIFYLIAPISSPYLFHINLLLTSPNRPTIPPLIIITPSYHPLHIFIYYLILLPDLQTSQWQHLFCATSVASVGNSAEGKNNTTMYTISDKPKRLIDLLSFVWNLDYLSANTALLELEFKIWFRYCPRGNLVWKTWV